MRIDTTAAISDMAHSAACSSSVLWTLPPVHMHEWSFICSGLTTSEMPAPPLHWAPFLEVCKRQTTIAAVSTSRNSYLTVHNLVHRPCTSLDSSWTAAVERSSSAQLFFSESRTAEWRSLIMEDKWQYTSLKKCRSCWVVQIKVGAYTEFTRLFSSAICNWDHEL